jgi:hypothetical protein
MKKKIYKRSTKNSYKRSTKNSYKKSTKNKTKKYFKKGGNARNIGRYIRYQYSASKPIYRIENFIEEKDGNFYVLSNGGRVQTTGEGTVFKFIDNVSAQAAQAKAAPAAQTKAAPAAQAKAAPATQAKAEPAAQTKAAPAAQAKAAPVKALTAIEIARNNGLQNVLSDTRQQAQTQQFQDPRQQAQVFQFDRLPPPQNFGLTPGRQNQVFQFGPLPPPEDFGLTPGRQNLDQPDVNSLLGPIDQEAHNKMFGIQTKQILGPHGFKFGQQNQIQQTQNNGRWPFGAPPFMGK